MIVNAASLKELYTGFNAAFNTGFRAVTPDYEKVATRVPSTTRETKYAWLGQMPKLREWVGDRHAKRFEGQSYTLVNKDYEGTVAVERNDIEDDQFGVYGPLFQEMGHATGVFPDELVFGLLAGGFTTACYDGQYFFDTDHPVGNGVVSNMQAGAGNPWFLLDTSRSLKPLIFQSRKEAQLVSLDRPDNENVFIEKKFLYGVDLRCNVGFGFWQQSFGSKDVLNAANFSAAFAAMLGFKSDEGRPLGVRPTLLVVGPSNRAAALETIKAERNAAGATNINQNAVDVLVSPYLV